MTTSERYTLYGGLGSPYSMKLRAVMRYRRLPHVWIVERGARQIALQGVKAKVIPVLRYPDGTFHNDSTPLIYDLERRHPADRSTVPPDAGIAFVAFLIEDFADEWLTKSMFLYRWLRERDQVVMSRTLAFDAPSPDSRPGLAGIEDFARAFRERQVGRMALVGCTRENQPLIEASTKCVLAALEAQVTDSHFLFGTRPSLAEFGLYGQISQLGVDPTACDLMRAEFPFTWRWLAHVDDLSGVEGEWRDAREPLPAVVPALLQVAGEVYLPFLKANAAAVDGGAETFEFEACGHPYRQSAFKYQVKCLQELRRAYAALPAGASAAIDALLEQTDCLRHLREKGV